MHGTTVFITAFAAPNRDVPLCRVIFCEFVFKASSSFVSKLHGQYPVRITNGGTACTGKQVESGREEYCGMEGRDITVASRSHPRRRGKLDCELIVRKIACAK